MTVEESEFQHLKQKEEYNYDSPSPGILDIFPAPQIVGETFYRSDEVTALCPITGQPDYYEVEILLYDHAHCLESKSLKLYLGAFRQHAGFAESLATQIAKDVGSRIKPGGVRVTVKQKSRGGISIESSSSTFTS